MKYIVLAFSVFLLASCANEDHVSYDKPETIETWSVFSVPGEQYCFTNLRWRADAEHNRRVIGWASNKIDPVEDKKHVIAIDFVSQDLLIANRIETGISCEDLALNVAEDFPYDFSLEKAEALSYSDDLDFETLVECSFSFGIRQPEQKRFNQLIDLFYEWNSGVIVLERSNDTAIGYTNRNCHLDRDTHVDAYVQTLKDFGLGNIASR